MLPAFLRCLWGGTADKVHSLGWQQTRARPLRSCFRSTCRCSAEGARPSGELGLQSPSLRAVEESGGICPWATCCAQDPVLPFSRPPALCQGPQMGGARLRLILGPGLILLLSIHKQSKRILGSEKSAFCLGFAQLQKTSTGVWPLLGLAWVPVPFG